MGVQDAVTVLKHLCQGDCCRRKCPHIQTQIDFLTNKTDFYPFSQVMAKLGVKDGVTLLKQFDEKSVVFDGKVSDTEKLKAFVTLHRVPVSLGANLRLFLVLCAVVAERCGSTRNLSRFMAMFFTIPRSCRLFSTCAYSWRVVLAFRCWFCCCVRSLFRQSVRRDSVLMHGKLLTRGRGDKEGLVIVFGFLYMP